MPFNINTFNAKLMADNPTHARFIKSDLDAVVKLLRTGGFSLDNVAVEMKKISKAKWAKYSQTRAYLISQFPLLLNLLRGTVVGLKTILLTRHLIGIEHRFVFVSDTGDLGDLQHIKTRENVSWDVPPAEIIPHMNPDPMAVGYKVSGNHYGQVLGDAWFPQHTDTHGSRSAFKNCHNYSGPPLTLKFNQTYEFRVDGVWHTVPNSQFTLERTLSSRGGRGLITMTKTNVARPQETARSELFFDYS